MAQGGVTCLLQLISCSYAVAPGLCWHEDCLTCSVQASLLLLLSYCSGTVSCKPIPAVEELSLCYCGMHAVCSNIQLLPLSQLFGVQCAAILGTNGGEVLSTAVGPSLVVDVLGVLLPARYSMQDQQ